MATVCCRIRRWVLFVCVLLWLRLSFEMYRYYRDVNEISKRNTIKKRTIVAGAPIFTDTVSKVEKIEKSTIFNDPALKDKRLMGFSRITHTESIINEMAEYSMKTDKVPNYRDISQPISNTRYNKEKITGGLKYTAGPGNDLLLLTAIVGNMSANSPWNKISIQGWQASSLRKTTFSLCVYHRSGLMKKYSNVTRYSMIHKRVPSIATQFVCHLEGDYGKDPPEYVTITNRKGPHACQINFSLFLKTSFAFRHPGEIAVFAKILFGNLSADAIISWFEIHKLFGFHKVYIYTHELNPSAMKVLRYYEEEGKAELIPFFKPGPEHGKPSVKLGTKNPNGWNDEKVALFDGTERLRGYEYLVAFDVDEYLIPTRGSTWRDLFDTIFSQYPKLAGAMFYTYLYLKDWGPTSRSSPFEVACYLNRTGPTKDRPKHVVKPARLANAGFHTHKFKPVRGYRNSKAYTCPEDLVGIHHYRDCRHDWVVKNSTVQCTSERIFDDRIFKLFKIVEHKIINLKNKLGV